MSEPTGKERYRVQTLGSLFWKRQVLVLQIEVTGVIYTHIGGMADSYDETWWKDCPVTYKLERDKP